MMAGVAWLVGGLWVGPAAAQVRPALVRDADNPAFQPFRQNILVHATAAELFKYVDGPIVPAGKRLVIENVSIWALTGSADFVTGLWLTVPGADPVTFAIMDPVGDERKEVAPGSAVAAYNRVVKLYYNPGETIQAAAFFRGTTSNRIVNIYMSGYYVNIP
jgi:hypothetical protein